MPQTNIYLPRGESFVYKLTNAREGEDFVGYKIYWKRCSDKSCEDKEGKIAELTKNNTGGYEFDQMPNYEEAVTWNIEKNQFVFEIDRDIRIKLKDIERTSSSGDIYSEDDAIFRVREAKRPVLADVQELDEGESVFFSCETPPEIEQEVNRVYYTLDGVMELGEASLVLEKSHHKKELRCHVEFTRNGEDTIRPAEYDTLASEPLEIRVKFIPAQPEIDYDPTYCEEKKDSISFFCNDSLVETNPPITEYKWKKNGVAIFGTSKLLSMEASELANSEGITCQILNEYGASVESTVFTSSDVCTSNIKAAGIMIASASVGVIVLLALVGFVIYRKKSSNSKDEETMKLDGSSAAYEYSSGAPMAPHRGPPTSSGSDTSLVDHSDNRYAAKFDYDPKQQTNNNSSGHYHSLDRAKMGKPTSKHPIGHKDRVDYVEFSSSTVDKR
ncbi:unnamed protein product [Oikopleura dioica]|uniref:Ig-like domain-containing protein n=1 Tax=Oikopleura dioica TaxID=34765 RepID=E4YE13_OIKDI|nr:unnamed protein product [Oikopleura dioica]